MTGFEKIGEIKLPPENRKTIISNKSGVWTTTIYAEGLTLGPKKCGCFEEAILSYLANQGQPIVLHRFRKN